MVIARMHHGDLGGPQPRPPEPSPHVAPSPCTTSCVVSVLQRCGPTHRFTKRPNACRNSKLTARSTMGTGPTVLGLCITHAPQPPVKPSCRRNVMRRATLWGQEGTDREALRPGDSTSSPSVAAAGTTLRHNRARTGAVRSVWMRMADYGEGYGEAACANVGGPVWRFVHALFVQRAPQPHIRQAASAGRVLPGEVSPGDGSEPRGFGICEAGPWRHDTAPRGFGSKRHFS